ncbi:hypothetical protein [Oricola sp.]|uniref:hypothetical protein n=1 Tax=Oricola sp. TaxID=1979950 RepID=UPI0025F115DE|nr:hypothetical protein [Oricola sp.]MCI5074331.1 hypothetical protein [Oricola sp.]
MGIRVYGRSFRFWLGALVLGAVLVNVVLWLVGLVVATQGEIAAGDCGAAPLVRCIDNAPIPLWAQTVLNWPAHLYAGALDAVTLGRKGLTAAAWAAGILVAVAYFLKLVFEQAPAPRPPADPDAPSFWTTESFAGNLLVAALIVVGLVMAISLLGAMLFPRGGGGLFYPTCFRSGLFSVVKCPGLPFGVVVEFVFAIPLVAFFALLTLVEPNLGTAISIGTFFAIIAIVATLLTHRAKIIRRRREARTASSTPGGEDPA